MAVQGGGGEGLAGEGCAEVARQTDPDGLPVVTHPLIDCVPNIVIYTTIYPALLH